MTDEEPESPFAVISKTTDPELPASPRGIVKKALALGWEVKTLGSTTRHEPVLLMNDGKTGQRGEVKTPAHDKAHIWVSGNMPGARIGFTATWVDRKFVEAQLHDVLGFQVENYFEYKQPAVRRAKDEPQWAFEARQRAAIETARRQNYEYNDGTTRTENTVLVSKMGDLTDFLNDYLSITTERSTE